MPFQVTSLRLAILSICVWGAAGDSAKSQDLIPPRTLPVVTESAPIRPVSSAYGKRPALISSFQDNAPSPSDQETVVPVPQDLAGPVVEVTPPATEQEPRESLAPLQNRELVNAVTAIDISISGIGTGDIPHAGDDRVGLERVGLPDGVSRGAVFQCVHWSPSLIQHYPLYFEDAMLERHGHVRWGHLQPAASATKFFTHLAMLPYLKTLQPKHECVYALGNYRSGTCAPTLRGHLPYDLKAASVESLSVAGFFWAAPL